MKLPRVFYWVFGGAGFSLLLTGLVIFYVGQKEQNQYAKVEGTVMRNQYIEGMARPVIRYTWQGAELLYADNTYTNPPVYERGEKVELFVNPNDPNDVWINSFMSRYFVMTIVSGLGLFILGFLTLFHFAFNKSS